jgi:hypothetical protein
MFVSRYLIKPNVHQLQFTSKMKYIVLGVLIALLAIASAQEYTSYSDAEWAAILGRALPALARVGGKLFSKAGQAAKQTAKETTKTTRGAGPSGLAKIHNKQHSTRKQAKEAAQRGSQNKSKPEHHQKNPKQPNHYHSTQKNGSVKKDGVHHNYGKGGQKSTGGSYVKNNTKNAAANKGQNRSGSRSAGGRSTGGRSTGGRSAGGRSAGGRSTGGRSSGGRSSGGRSGGRK